ncbi:hypothetical protein Cgig2_008756 [Carnegiea gigantea]|uniref:DUF4283 domain-containing protein n=1 Tax=Carnegiea gigantea TaxID=171969 RepID=A0A9Q1K6R5_9CARY|nr:hypothetical protein Cgig2_008756 [Carnegiea gigantea]
MDLDIKYWGMVSLSKLGSILGIPIKTDRYTMEKTRLTYARLLIEMPVDDTVPGYIEFVNDQEVVVRLEVKYKWKPLKCLHCRIYGHIEEDCRKKVSNRQEWREVPAQTSQSRGEAEQRGPADQGRTPHPQAETSTTKCPGQLVDPEGFITVRRPITRPPPSPLPLQDAMRGQNTFEPLQEPFDESSLSKQQEGPPNVQNKGLNWSNKQEDVKIFLNEKNIGFVRLLETKVKENNVDRITNNMFRR